MSLLTDPITSYTEPAAELEPISMAEGQELAECERIIREGLKTFVAVGNALSKIRDGRLYRSTHATFEEYCLDVFKLSLRHSNRLIMAAEVVKDLGPIGPKPVNEAQARALGDAPPELRQEAWNRAVQTAPGGQVTAAHVAEVVREMGPIGPKPEPPAVDYGNCFDCGRSLNGVGFVYVPNGHHKPAARICDGCDDARQKRHRTEQQLARERQAEELAAQERQRDAERRRREEWHLRLYDQAADLLMGRAEIGSRELALFASSWLYEQRGVDVCRAMETLGVALEGEWEEVDELDERLAELPPLTIVRLAVLSSSPSELAWYLGVDPDPPGETPAVFPALAAPGEMPTFAEWREGLTDAPLPADQCTTCGRQLTSGGTCPACGSAPAREADYEVLCFRCGDALPVLPCVDDECEHLANGVTVDPRGCIATPQGAYYCRGCRPTIRICRQCGCTNEAGCDEGCSWVELDLCSACSKQLQLIEAETTKPSKAVAAAIRIADLEAQIVSLGDAATVAAEERIRAEKLRGSKAALPRRMAIHAEELEKRAGQIATLRRKIERVRAGAVEPDAPPAVTYPRPNAHGVYSDEGAVREEFETETGLVVLRAVEIAAGQWIWAHHYEIKGSGEGCGGAGEPLKEGRSAPTREAAFLVAATEARARLQARLDGVSSNRRPEGRQLLTWLDERIQEWSAPPAASDWTEAWNAWAEGKPTQQELPCVDCGRPIDLRQGVYRVTRDGQDRPLCDECHDAEPPIPEGLRGVQAGDLVSGSGPRSGTSFNRCRVLEVNEDGLVISVLFGKKSMHWTSLANFTIAEKANPPETTPHADATPDPGLVLACTECGLVLGGEHTGTGVPVKGALLCGQCHNTNTVRAKHGLELIPAEGWAAKRLTSSPDGPQPASPKFQPGDLIEWYEGDGLVEKWLGLVLGTWPFDGGAYRVISYRPEIALRKVFRCAVQGGGIGRLAQSKPVRVTDPGWAPGDLMTVLEPIRAAKQLRSGALVQSRTDRDVYILSSRATAGGLWLGVALSPGNRTDVEIGQEVSLPTQALIKGFELRGLPPIPAAYLPAAAQQSTPAPPQETWDVIDVAAAAKGDRAAWPVDGVLYQGKVFDAFTRDGETAPEFLVIDTSCPVVKRTHVPLDTEGLVIMAKRGAE